MYGRGLLEFLGMSRQSQADDIDANQLIALLKTKDEELQTVLSKGLTLSIYQLKKVFFLRMIKFSVKSFTRLVTTYWLSS